MQEKINYPYLTGALTSKFGFLADDLYILGIITKDNVEVVERLIEKNVNDAEKAAIKFAKLMGE